jgi:hypothetical protein
MESAVSIAILVILWIVHVSELCHLASADCGFHTPALTSTSLGVLWLCPHFLLLFYEDNTHETCTNLIRPCIWRV